MVKKAYRFHGYGALRGVYLRGQTVRGAQLSLKFSRRSSDRPCRVAVVVSRKVSKSAVVRNRIRRRIYEQLRPRTEQLGGYDLLFTAFHEQLATIEIPKLNAMINDLLRKATRE
jgi:ribonuclease P protein component